MSQKANHTKIGLFIVLATVLLVAGTIWLGAGSMFQQVQLVESYFLETVQGLEVGSPLKYRGVQIGEVREIHIAEEIYEDQIHDEDRVTFGSYVVVILAVNYPSLVDKDDVKRESERREAVAAGLRFILTQQGITGVAYLEANFLDPEKNPPLEYPWTPENFYIPSAPSAFERISTSAVEIFHGVSQVDFAQLGERATALLDELRADLRDSRLDEVSERGRELIGNLNDVVVRMGEILSAPELDGAGTDVAALLENSRSITEQVDQSLPELLEDLRNSIARLESTLRRADRVLAGPERGIDDIVENLRQASRNLKELTEDTRAYPSQAIFGVAPPPAPQEDR